MSFVDPSVDDAELPACLEDCIIQVCKSQLTISSLENKLQTLSFEDNTFVEINAKATREPFNSPLAIKHAAHQITQMTDEVFQKTKYMELPEMTTVFLLYIFFCIYIY